ncbi:MAG: hypothetical protein AAGB32_00715 [Pseudomonadota bacterium]
MSEFGVTPPTHHRDELPADHIRHTTIGYGAFGVAKEYQLLLLYKRWMEQNPNEPAPFHLEMQSFNEGDDFNRGPAYKLSTNYLALNFPASIEDPDSPEAACSSAETMDLVRDMEAKDFCRWIDEERAKAQKDPADFESVRAIYDDLIEQGKTEIQIAATMSYEEYKTYKLCCEETQGVQPWAWRHYFPRSMYGEYLEDRKERTKALIAEINEHYGEDVVTRVDTKPQTITSIMDIEPQVEGGFCFTIEVEDFKNGNRAFCTNMLTFATGHFYNEQFLSDDKRAELRKSSRFADSPYHDHEVVKMLDTTGGKMHIGGAGASMLDAIRGAEVWEGITGKKAEITIVTPQPDIIVWGHDLAKDGNYTGAERIYPAFIDTLQTTPRTPEGLEDLKKFMTQAVHSDEWQMIGPQNMFDVIRDNSHEIRDALGENADAFMKFLGRYETAKTSPESYESYQRFYQNGQIDYVAAYIDGNGIQNQLGKFIIPCTDPVTKENFDVTADGFADCFSLANAPFYRLRNFEAAPEFIQEKTLTFEVEGQPDEYLYVPDPLTREALAKGILVPDIQGGAVAAHPDYKDCVFVTGAGASRRRGVPFSQDLIAANGATFDALCGPANDNNPNAAAPTALPVLKRAGPGES